MGLSRSEQMARIRAKHTRPELRLRSALWSAGLRYRLHARTPVGRPDVVFPRRRVAVFVDGCFWHGCPDHYCPPRSRLEFWSDKLRSNVERDRRQTAELERQGWLVVRMWECQVNQRLEDVVGFVEHAVKQGVTPPPPGWRVVQVDYADPESPQLESRRLETLAAEPAVKYDARPRSTKKG